MKRILFLLFIIIIPNFAFATDDLNITIVDFSPDIVTNYFLSIFMWAAVLLVPFFGAIGLIMNVSSK